MLIVFDGDDNEKPPPKEMRKQVLQHALEQPLKEPVSVPGRLRTGLRSLYLKTANVKTISLEPQVTTDKAKTMQGKTEELTPIDKAVFSTKEKETMAGHKAMLVNVFTSFSHTHSA